MKKIKLDTGLVTYEIGGGVLRFNPADPNVYSRFQQAMKQLESLEASLSDDGETPLLEKMQTLDRSVKALLNTAFGPGNDFDRICGGVSLFSRDHQGVSLMEKLMAALEPVLLDGARQCAKL